MYQRAGVVVRAAPEVEADPAGGQREVVREVEVSDSYLEELFGRAAQFEKYRVKGDVEVITVPIGCPPNVAKGYLHRKGQGWRLPELKGVIHVPTLRADGSILDLPGYDGRTGLYYDPREQYMPEVPQLPGKAQAEAAIAALDDLLTEVDFVGPVDRAVALAAILTATIRRSLPAAPLFGFTAPTPGTGKSVLVSIVSMIASGKPASGFTWTDDDAENRKQLDSALLGGAGVIAFDNVTAPLGGNRLCQMLTEARATIRPLGQSRLVDVPCDALVTANGNNLVIEADMTRRALLCRLDAKVERPELRVRKRDPIAEVRDGECGHLVAALTVLRAYHVAGRPAQPKPLGSFEAWSNWVRGALVWLGYADPVASIEHVRADDPTLSALTAVLEQWDRTIGSRRVTTAGIIDHVRLWPEFREGLLAVAGRGGSVNTMVLGRWLGKHKGKMVGSLRLESLGITTGLGYWAIRGGRAEAEPVGSDDVVVPLRTNAPGAVPTSLSLAELLK